MFTKLARNRFLRVTGLAVGAVAVAGAAVVVTASAAGMSFGFKAPASAPQAVDASSASSSACASFMKHFAVDIGKSQADINTAFKKAVAETLADEVKSGQISQAQADIITKKLANGTPCTLPNTAPRGGGEKGALGAFMQQYLAAAASALGITQTQLTTDLKNGQSLSQIAAAQHVTEADFRTKLIAGLMPTLDQAVKDKKITAAQEQTIISRLQTGPLPLWNMPTRKPKPAATATPSPA